MSSEAKEPGQRAYEAYAAALGDDPAGDRWHTGEDGYKRAWVAVEQACAVPASGSLDDVFKYARFIPNMLIKAWDKGYSAGSADKARGAFGAERNPYLCLGKSKP